MTTLVESCRVGPPPGTVTDQSLPLAFQDIFWLHFHPIRRLLFYDLPPSELDASDNLVPKLKRSLTLALQHYFPLAGKLVYPSNPDENLPVIRFGAGDSVPLEIFESADDFDILVGNQPRDADAFYNYIPQLPAIITDESGQKLLHLLALQLTLFPGRGICIGISNHHVAGDASSIVGFIRAWASICKLSGAEGSLAYEYPLPVFNRDLVKDTLGLNSIVWNKVKKAPLIPSSFPLPTNRARATYILTQAQIKKLKDSVAADFAGFAYPSSFVVTSAYVWTCLAKSFAFGEEGNEVDDDEMEFFLFTADIRGRVDPPLPDTYFGNFLSGGLARARHKELVGPGGFFLAARAIAEQVKHVVNLKNRAFERLEERVEEIRSIVGKRVFSVSGSARVDLYGADIGLGRARKLETVSIDGEKYSMSLCKPRDCEGGLEFGLSLPKAKMDAFAVLFNDGLN